MHQIAEELDRKLSQLDRATAERLEQVVRDALVLAEKEPPSTPSGWPEGYFERTAGALAGEEFERPNQGEVQEREAW